MKTFKCPYCGGTLSLNAHSFREAVCPYCGNSFMLTEADWGISESTGEILKEMVGGKAVGEFIARKLHEANEDAAWKHGAHHLSFPTDKCELELAFRQQLRNGAVEMFVCRSNIALLFDSGADAEAYLGSVRRLKYPGRADSRSLRQYMPDITADFSLTDGRRIVIIARGSHEFPLINYVNMPHVHAAWVTSRLENICCLMEYNDVSVKDLNIRDLFVDVQSHQISLYGAFWRLESHTSDRQLSDLRSIVRELVGLDKKENRCADGKPIPEAFYDFLSESPQPTAFQDFERWDAMLMLSYHNRTFVKYEEN